MNPVWHETHCIFMNLNNNETRSNNYWNKIRIRYMEY
jgi:hypothetical protein